MNQLSNNKGHLMLGGVSAIQLKNKYGTPLYVMDEKKIRDSMRIYTSALKQGYDSNGLVCYASKAFCCKEIYRIAQSEGLGADIVSGGELYTAKQAGFDLSNTCLHGNNKTEEELLLAIKSNVGRIVADNPYELQLIDRLAKSAGSQNKVRVMLRLRPGVEAHTHAFIQTGQIDSKFGVAIETGEALQAVRMALTLPNIDFCGIHCHIGSQIFDSEPFMSAAEIMINFLDTVKKATGTELKEINLGGGFGIAYTKNDDPCDIKENLLKLFDTVRTHTKKLGLNLPFILLEPGRSIVAEAGTTLYTVGESKHIPSIRTYLAVDGGMCDNPRFILYGAKYDMAIANKMNQKKNKTYTVAGKCCESGDLIGKKVLLQKAENGDVLAVFCTGAYNFSMFSNYNRNLRPAVVMVNDGVDKLIVRRETYDELIQNDI